MDDSAFDECGKQLCEFLAKQVAPPPGAKCVLGFLGQGVAVDPDSLLSNGEFNPARVNAWLNIVVEPLGSIGNDDNRVDPVPFTAYKLMDSVCNFSVSSAPTGSEAQQTFAKIKGRAMESLGGAATVDTAPLDWYDPKHLPEWPKCSLATTTTTKIDSSNKALSSLNACPAGGTHDPSRSSAYAMRVGDGGQGTQAGWRWCQKCQGLFAMNADLGAWPAGGREDPSRT